ncbi:VUT family protein [uncultured Bartonella sp.]|uniref:VUT family protein n=1 Tax=uncultured Bartonella sp. TaxID=104108 RepID=UPI0026233380|nr:VUT family protein [uncultured Bartonella sp.]
MKQTRHLFLAIFAMCIAVTASNILVQFPLYWFGLEHLLTYGAFTYPFAFLINDLTNRRYGPQAARRIVYAGFVAGFVVSWILASPRLAIASGTAFLFAQLLDIIVFNPLRRKSWWIAPLAAALTGSALDTLWFFAVAFSSHFSFIDRLTGYSDGSITEMTSLIGLDVPVWLSLSLGDFSVKVVMGVLMLLPYGAILAIFMPDIYHGEDSRKGDQTI